MFLVLAAGALGAQPSARDKWIVGRSDHFTIYSDAREPKAREILLAMEQLRAVLAAMSKANAGAEPRTVVYAFGSSRSLEPYFAAPTSRGIVRMVEYRTDADATYVLLNAAEKTEEVLPWAYRAHLYEDVHRRFPELPLWARTGLAHFYATTQVDRKETVRVGRPDREHLERLRDYTWIPLDRLFRVDQSSSLHTQAHSLGLFQAQCWILSHYVLTGAGTGDLAVGGAFYGALLGGLSPEEAIRQVFGQDLPAFSDSLKSYSRGLTLSYLTLKLPGIPRDPDVFAFAPASLGDVTLRLGQHLVRALDPPPVELAEQHLKPLTEDPELAGDAWAALAELRDKSGRPDEARQLYETALAAAPRQAMSYYEYARFLETAHGDRARIRQALEAAVRIDPALGDAWARLAGTYFGEDATRQVEYLRKAIALMPQRPDVAFNLAMALLGSGDPVAARQVVAAYLRNPDDAEQARSAEQEIDRFELVQATNQAIQSGDLNAAIERYEEALARVRDPVQRAQMQIQLQDLRQQATRREHVDRYNAIVADINRGELDAGAEALRQLLAEAEDASLRQSIETLLEELAKRR